MVFIDTHGVWVSAGERPKLITLPPSWRAAHVNAAERLGWNTIEVDD